MVLDRPFFCLLAARCFYQNRQKWQFWVIFSISKRIVEIMVKDYQKHRGEVSILWNYFALNRRLSLNIRSLAFCCISNMCRSGIDLLGNINVLFLTFPNRERSTMGILQHRILVHNTVGSILWKIQGDRMWNK